MRGVTGATVAVMLLAALGTAAGPVATAQSVPLCDEEEATAFLTSPGTLLGTPGDDVLVGSTWNDVIKGLGGDDTICGEPDDVETGGDDAISGGSGRDRLFGGPGDDTLGGDAGNDRLRGQLGDDVLRGGSGDDSVADFEGNNDGDGGQGDDQVSMTGTARGGSGSDDVTAHNDDSFPGAGCNCAPYASGGSGADPFVQVFGSGGIADGGSGNDGAGSGEYVGGQEGAVELRGGSANDNLVAFNDNLILNGGAGYDACSANGLSGVTFISCEVQFP